MFPLKREFDGQADILNYIVASIIKRMIMHIGYTWINWQAEICRQVSLLISTSLIEGRWWGTFYHVAWKYGATSI